jgi:hypothetical protein
LSPRLIEVPNPDPMLPTKLRRFADPIIQSQIDGVIDRMKPESTVAAVAHADGSGASLSLVYRAGRHLSVMAGAYKPWHGKLGAEGEIVWEG